jgi:flagellar motor switch protein FliM
MSEVLSQTEIDALLAAVSTGDLKTESDGGQNDGQIDWIAYDLTSQEKIIRSRFVALEGIHDRFSSLFRVTLSSMLKRPVTVNCINTDFLRFGDYLTNILLPTSLNVLVMPNLKGHAIMVVSSKLTYALVDAYYGGSERPFSKIGGREEFTSVENRLIHKVVDSAIGDLKTAWKLNYPVEFAFMRSESNPQFVGSIHASELVAVVSFEVEFENLSGPFVLIIQLSALESVQSHLSVNLISDISSDAAQWREHWLREILRTKLDVRAELGTTSRTLRQVHELKEGDRMLLAQDAASPVTVYVEGLPKMTGMMGTHRGNAAVRLNEPLKSRE